VLYLPGFFSDEDHMNVIAFNGSPNKDGNTHRLIRSTLDEIEKEEIKTELIQIGGKKISPCNAC